MPSPRRWPGAARRPCWSPARPPSPTRPGVEVRHIETAEEMLAACRAALPADIAVCAAAVADWRPAAAGRPQKIKKGERRAAAPRADRAIPTSSRRWPRAGNARPRLVVGFAAETENLIANAKKKLAAKGCDWIVANDVSPGTGTFGGDENTSIWSRPPGSRAGRRCRKREVAERLADTHRSAALRRRPETASPVRRIEVPLQRLAHGAGLPLPAYATARMPRASISWPRVGRGGRSCAPGGRALVPTGISIALPARL